MEFYINNEKCYFCGHEGLVRTHEHWSFCPKCMAIYTFMLVWESECEHIKEGVPFIRSEPCYQSSTMKPFIIAIEEGQRCSECFSECYADGW